MNNKYLYAKEISLKNVLKFLFKQELNTANEINSINNILITHFKIIDSIGERDFKNYFISNNFISNNSQDVFTFFSNNIGKLIFGFRYNYELRKFNVGIFFDNTISDSEIFQKLSTELYEPDFSFIFKDNGKIFGENAERIRLLYWLRNIASEEIGWLQNIALEEYKKGFMFYSELITIQDLIIEAYELLA